MKGSRERTIAAYVYANAVVVSAIPDLSVAVGIPARVIRKFDPALGEWKEVMRDDREIRG
jgi:serine acetyltransferase